MSKKTTLAQRCPDGHSIPHKTENGECTPLYCAVNGEMGLQQGELKRSKRSKTLMRKGAERRKAEKEMKTKFKFVKNMALEKATKELVEEVRAQPLSLPDGASVGLAQEGRIEALSATSIAAGKLGARLAFINDLPHKDADEVTINNWADKKAVQLLPLAIAEKEYMLKFGDDEQREKASDRVLAMNGRLQKEGHLSGGAAIILHMEGGAIQLPYAPQPSDRLKPGPKPKTVDGEVVDAKEP